VHKKGALIWTELSESLSARQNSAPTDAKMYFAGTKLRISAQKKCFDLAGLPGLRASIQGSLNHQVQGDLCLYGCKKCILQVESYEFWAQKGAPIW
jgi:hypothetical protein